MREENKKALESSKVLKAVRRIHNEKEAHSFSGVKLHKRAPLLGAPTGSDKSVIICRTALIYARTFPVLYCITLRCNTHLRSAYFFFFFALFFTHLCLRQIFHGVFLFLIVFIPMFQEKDTSGRKK